MSGGGEGYRKGGYFVAPFHQRDSEGTDLHRDLFFGVLQEKVVASRFC
jgi:hypothetical protein